MEDQFERERPNIDMVLPEAERNEVGVMVKRTIANAAWKTIEQQYEGYRDYARPYHDRFEEMGLSLEMLGLAGDPAQVWPEIALRFTLSFPGVHTAIIGTTRPKSAEANLFAVAKGALPDEMVSAIRSAFRNADPAGAWTGQT